MNPEILNATPSSQAKIDQMNLQKAVDLGEYDPEYLSTFTEWHELTKHLQWRMVREALKNRRQSLTMNWAEVQNQPNYSKKPHLKIIQESIQKQLIQLQEDEESLQNLFLNP